jgi:glycerate 2-kinase
MRIVIAPDSFKESMSAVQAATAMAAGVHTVWPTAQCQQLPLADGGEGTLDVLSAALHARTYPVNTVDALRRPITATFGLAPDGTAIIEAASVVGLGLVAPAQRRLEQATSYGLAAVICAARDAGATRMIIGVGGTATCDGGVGLLSGLGVRLLNAGGADVSADPAGLLQLARIETAGLDRWEGVSIELAADVTNPLLGPEGAVAVFAPQKGAAPHQLPALEAGLRNLIEALNAAGIRAVADLPGAGTGGGLGAAVLALGGHYRSGVELIANSIGLPSAIAAADLVLTGEGCLDAQTAAGKVPAGVLAIANAHNVPVIAFAGQVHGTRLGFADAVAISADSLPDSLARGPELLTAAVARRLKTWPAVSEHPSSN